MTDAADQTLTPTTKKARALIAYLATRADSWVSREQIADLLWGDQDSQHSRNSLRKCLQGIRHLSEADPRLLDIGNEAIRLNADALAPGSNAEIDDDVHTSLDRYRDAIVESDGTLLSDLGNISEKFDEWLALERTRRWANFVSSALATAEQQLQSSSAEQRAQIHDLVDRLAMVEQLDERVTRLGMRVDALLGDNAALIRRYNSLEARLWEDLAVDPSNETKILLKQLLERSGNQDGTDQVSIPAEKVDAPAQQEGGPGGWERGGQPRHRLKWVALASILAAAALGFVLLRPAGMGEVESVTNEIAILPANSAADPEVSSFWSMNLASDLTELDATELSGTVFHVDQIADRTRLAIELDVMTPIKTRGITLRLTSRDGTLVWSKSFESTVEEALLRRRLAIHAADAIKCGLEADGDGVAPRIMVSYLSVCTNAESLPSIGRIIALRSIVEKAPSFHRANAELALAEAKMANIASMNPISLSEARAMAIQARTRFAELPRDQIRPGVIAVTSFHLAQTESSSDFEEQEKLLIRGIESDLSYIETRVEYASLLTELGRMREAVAAANETLEIGKTSLAAHASAAHITAYAGKPDVARKILDDMKAVWPEHDTTRYAESAIELRYGNPDGEGMQGDGSTWERSWRTLGAARSDPTPQNIESAVEFFRKEYEERPQTFWAYIQVLGQFGQNDRAYAMLERATDAEIRMDTSLYFRSYMKPLRQDRRFLKLMDRAGLLEYWRASGNWPDFCMETDLPYDCNRGGAN